MQVVKIEIRLTPTIVVTLLVLTIAILGLHGNLDSVDGQTNSTTNKTTATPAADPATTTSAQEQASQSIRGAITETGEFLGNVTEKVATSKSAGTIVNESSNVLGNVTVETKRYFSPKSN